MPSGSDLTVAEMLDDRALNRALLARQHLLDHIERPVPDVVEHLVGLQAQEPDDPYLALWNRIRGFGPDDLSALLSNRDMVRIPLQRATIHLVTARDALALRPVLQSVLTGVWGSQSFSRGIPADDLDAMLADGRELVEQQPRTRAELGRILRERWPDCDPTSIGHAVTYLLPVLQVTPRGLWRTSGPAAWTTVRQWLSHDLPTDTSPDDLVLRYLTAFGPAATADVRTWSRLTGLRDVIARLRPQLRTFRDGRGRELLDVPEGLLPDPDLPAPPRFLGEFDNILLSHADRERILADEDRRRMFAETGGFRTVLVDGFVQARWRLHRDGDTAAVEITPLRQLRRADRSAVADEAVRLLAFLAPEATDHRVRFTSA